VGKATLGGYGGGLGIKKTLLKLERDRLLDKLIE
jgi:O6-methylguanine-DNA--protein-cysteine methyltransferase